MVVGLSGGVLNWAHMIAEGRQSLRQLYVYSVLFVSKKKAVRFLCSVIVVDHKKAYFRKHTTLQMISRLSPANYPVQRWLQMIPFKPCHLTEPFKHCE